MKTLFIVLTLPLLCHSASITISGNNVPLVINTAIAGESPTSVTGSSSCSITVPQKKTLAITAQLSSATPLHTTLKMTLGNSSPLELQTVPQTLATGIKEGSYENLLITYEYGAKIEAGVCPLETKTIILTLIESESL